MTHPQDRADKLAEEREAFEAWCQTNAFASSKLNTGKYAACDTEWCWQAWQAARAPLPAEELDTRECDECAGAGWNWEERQVAERKTDVQEFKIDCDACCGRGFVGPDADLRAARAAQPKGEAVFLVATGETHNGQETYTRHDGAPPPLCDFERLYAAPPAQPVAVPAEGAHRRVIEWLAKEWGGQRTDFASHVLSVGGTGDYDELMSFVKERIGEL